MTTKQVEYVLIKNLADRAFPIYLKNYQNRGFSEADIFGISGAGMMYEFEIKVSRSDFLADFKNKEYKHRQLSERRAIYKHDVWKRGKRTGDTYDLITIPNRFYYACHEGLIKIEEVPEYAGLVYINKNEYIEAKPAPILHHHKANEIIYKNIATILSERNEWGCAYRSYKLKKQKLNN